MLEACSSPEEKEEKMSSALVSPTPLPPCQDGPYGSPWAGPGNCLNLEIPDDRRGEAAGFGLPCPWGSRTVAAWFPPCIA